MESYTEFMEELREKVAEKLGEGYETEIHQIAKANAGVMDALTVFQSGGKAKAGPNFYLPPLFREHRAGREVGEIAGDIVAMYHAQAPGMEELADSLGDITQYENIKGRLYFRLLNTGKNRAFLKDVLHFMVLDLSMVVYILVREDGDGIGSVPVQNRLLESWGVPAAEVKGQAERNTPLLFPPKVLHLASVMADILRDAGAGGMAELQAAAEDRQEGAWQEGPYIMTNTKGINGFSVVLYPEALKDFAASAGKDLYILPSSLHEALLFPADKSITPQELQGIVRDKTSQHTEGTDNEAVRQGHDLEGYVAHRFMEATGKKVRRSNFMYCHEKYPFMIADVDRLVTGEDAGLECKTANAYNADKWKGGKIPLHYVVQCYHYMAVTGKKAWYIAAVILGVDFVYYKLEWDDELIRQLIETEKNFWLGHVAAGKMPEPDGSESCNEALQQYYHTARKGSAMELHGFEEKLSWREGILSQIEELKKEQSRIEQEVKLQMKEHELAASGKYRISWSNVDTARFDTKRFKEDEPELYNNYAKIFSSRRFQVKAA